MAPTRKTRSVNKRFSDYTEVSPDKDVGNSNKSRGRKRKLCDMLGSQWSEEELERFYEAYRKHGKDWKKVAGVLRNRTVEMVEALYNMNKAYLSLPEGTASVVGLIAMMTDHYHVLEGSESDQEGNDALRLSCKSQKRGQGKVRVSGSKELLQSQSVPSNDCLPFLPRRGSVGFVVRKRTPRIPVSYSYRKDNFENYVSPNKRRRKLDVDEDVAHVAALALTEASHRGGSSQVSQSPFRTDHIKSSLLKGRERMPLQSDKVRAKLRGIMMDGDCLEGSLGSRGPENGDNGRDTSTFMDTEGFGTIEVHQKGKKFFESKENVRFNQYEDGHVASSGTEGLCFGDVQGKADIEVRSAKIDMSTYQGKRKKNKKLLFEDEHSCLDALHTLADLSLMMPASKVESESSVQLKEEKPNVDLADRSSVLEASTRRRRDTTKQMCGSEKVLNGKSKLGRESTSNASALCEGDQQRQSINKSWKKKRKSSSSKTSKLEACTVSHSKETPETGAFAEKEDKPTNKSKGQCQDFSPSKQCKSTRPVECSASDSDQTRAWTDSAVSTAQVPTTNEVNIHTKRKNRRKMNPKRLPIQKEMKFSEIISKDQFSKTSTNLDGDRLSCSLSSYMVRRWCTFEWFYSAIDYPWFAKREFVEYLNHVGLGHIPRLTRVEWGVIRSSLGKPRRFSENFLHEEREKLRQYRESVRKHYTELRAGIREGLPTDLARPLSVGQRVIALHPKSREVHDGSVLTVDHDKCRIQFDRPELGVEFVMDIDCMPSNPLENMPEALRSRDIVVLDKLSDNFREPGSGQFDIGGSMAFALNDHMENGHTPIHTSMKLAKGDSNCAPVAKSADNVNLQQSAYGQPYSVANNHAREADIRAISELTRSLDKKESILRELKQANDDLFKMQNEGDSFLKDSETYKKQYAMVLVQLKEASDQACFFRLA
ncbi:hypothetical protein LguiB_021196 [Lonicera macranthoides]